MWLMWLTYQSQDLRVPSVEMSNVRVRSCRDIIHLKVDTISVFIIPECASFICVMLKTLRLNIKIEYQKTAMHLKFKTV